jgi:CubicO group peptidase (beta-lactamase class C family)
MLTRKSLGKCILSAILALLLAGCSIGLISQPPTPIPTSEDVPVISQAELEEIIAGISQKYGVPAMAVALVTDQGLQQVAAVGVRKWGDPTPVTLDDSWPLGSDTKIMTSALASILVDQGKLSWDSTVSDMFPDIAASIYPDFKSVTLQQLLSHRAGLPHDINYGLLDQPASIQDQRVAAARMALSQKPTNTPGTVTQYSNVGYVIAGAMIERATGMDWESAIEQYLFSPLGMASAGFGGLGTTGMVDQPWGHYQSGPPEVCCNGRAAANNPLVLGPAGTVHCTIQDWAKFITDQLRGARGEPAFLSPQAYTMLLTNYGGDYSLGWALVEGYWAGGVAYWHAGSNGIYYADAWVVPNLNYAVMVLANAGGGNTGVAVQEAIEKVFEMIMVLIISEKPIVSNLEYGILWTCLVILVSVLVAVPILLWRIKDPAGTPKSIRRWVKAAAWIAWVNSLLFSILFFVSTLIQPLEIFVEYPIFLVFNLPFRAQFYVGFTYACVVLTIIQAIFTILVWKGKQRSLAERIYYSLATLAATGYILLLANWGLIAALY